MPSCPRPRPAALPLLLAAACATAPQRDVAPTGEPPLAVVAFLCADACRRDFAGADPLPYHAMAPATREEDGSFTIRYERRSDGRWAAVAEGRVLVVPSTADGQLPTTARYEQATGLDGFRGADATFVARVVPVHGRVRIECRASGFDSVAVVRHLEEAVAFADALQTSDDPAVRPCCAAHAPWRAHLLLRLARERMRHGDLLQARSALLQARADAPTLPGLDLRIGCLEQSMGQDALAASRLAAASRASDDPCVRAAAARSAQRAEARVRHPDGDGLRDAALALLGSGNETAAVATALAARTTDPDPVADLAFRHRLLRARGDAKGSLGTALLLREYGAGPMADRSLAQDLRSTGQLALADRAEARVLVSMIPESWKRAALSQSREWVAAFRSAALPRDLAAPSR